MLYFINDFNLDCVILTDYIRDLEFVDNKRRKKINNNKGKTYSTLYGITPYGILKKNEPKIFRQKDKKSNYYLTVAKSKYPILQDIFDEFKNLYFPDFDFTSVMINKNLQCKEHKDGLNTGESVMVGLGDYRGGLLGIRNEEGKVKLYETQHKLIKFNGSKYSHFTTDFTGERYTLIFFTPSWVRKKKN